jgi:SagB-type dehydrogenase family enzyme
VIVTPLIFYKDKFVNNIQLPSPDTKGEILLEEALAVVNQTPIFTPTEKLSLSIIGQLLWSMQGITHGNKRTTPSAGALYPLELYCYPFQVDGLAERFYHYNPQQHNLEIIHSKNFSKDYLNEHLFPESKHLQKGQALFFITMIPERTTVKYGSRGYQYIDLEIGHVLGNLYLQAVTTGVHVEPLFQFNHSEVENEFQLTEQLAAVIPIIKCESYNLVKLSNQQQEMIFGNNTKTNNLTVERAILARQSIRNYQQQDLQFAVLKRLCWYAFANKTNWLSAATKPVIFSKSKALALFLITEDRLKNSQAGIFEILENSFNFSLLKSGNYINELYEAGLSQSYIQTAAVNLLVTLNRSYLEKLPIDNALTLGLYDVGMISQFLYLEARNLDLGMVVIGAFHDYEIENMLGSNDFKPAYIIPLGIAELHSRNFFSTNQNTIGIIFGIISLVFYYIACFTATNPFKEKIENKWLLIHHLFSMLFTTIFLIGHFLLIIDIIPFLQSGELSSAFYEIVKKLVGYQLRPIDSFHKAGLLLSVIAFWLIISVNLLSIILYKIKKIKPEIRKTIHQVMIIVILLIIYLHTYANCLNRSLFYWLFLVTNLGIILLFFGIQFYPSIANLRKDSEEKIEKESLKENS